MSRGLNNPKAFSTQDEAESSPIITPAQITDAADFPHTGLIKALSLGMKGNYATTGFNATAVTATAVTFANGVVFRDGEEVGVTGSTITIGSTTGTTTDHVTGYHLVVNQTGTTTLTVHPPTGVDAVPAYDDDDVIIAILGYTTQTPMQIQYLTVNKSKNSLSVARSAGGTYTEMGTITADTDSLDIVTTNSNADIILDPHGTGDVKLGTLAIDGDQTVGAGQDGHALIYTHSNAKAALAAIPPAYADSDAISAVEGEATLDLTGDVTIAAGKDLTVGGGDIAMGNGQDSTIKVDATTSSTAGRDLTLEAGSSATGSANINGGDLILKAGGGDGTGTSIMTFSTKVSGTDVVAEKMRIHSDGNVGIGTNTPDTKLEVEGSSSDDVALTVTNSQDANDNETATLRLKSTRGTDSDFEIIHDVFGHTTLTSNQPDSDTRAHVKFKDDPITIFNPDGADMDLQVAGDTDSNLLYVNAGSDKVGIGTNAPTQKLGVNGAIGAAAFVGSVVEVTGSGLPPSVVSVLNLDSETHRTIIADTQASSPNPPNALSLNLPVASGTHQGWEMRIICKNNAGGVDDLTLDVTGSSDLIVDAQMATIGNASAGFSLATGKIYTVIHISSTMYMCIILN